MTAMADENVVSSFFDNVSAGRLDVALALMADTATWALSSQLRERSVA